MTIKEFYQWAKENNIENYDIKIYDDAYGWYYPLRYAIPKYVEAKHHAPLAIGAQVGIGLATTNTREAITGKAHYIIDDFTGMTYDKLLILHR